MDGVGGHKGTMCWRLGLRPRKIRKSITVPARSIKRSPRATSMCGDPPGRIDNWLGKWKYGCVGSADAREVQSGRRRLGIQRGAGNRWNALGLGCPDNHADARRPALDLRVARVDPLWQHGALLRSQHSLRISRRGGISCSSDHSRRGTRTLVRGGANRLTPRGRASERGRSFNIAILWPRLRIAMLDDCPFPFLSTSSVVAVCGPFIAQVPPLQA